MVSAAAFTDGRHCIPERRANSLVERERETRTGNYYSFADFTLDERHQTLKRGDELIPLPPQPFRLLVHLLRHRNRLVSKEELIEAAWSGLAISDSAFASALYAARRAVGDNGHDQGVIVTCRKRGYNFRLPVVELLAADNES